MLKKLLFVSAFALAASVLPEQASAATSIEIIDVEPQAVNISLRGRVLHVTGAEGLTLTVYNVTGVPVMTVKVDSNNGSYNLNLPNGCYMVKVGKTVRKISIGKKS